MNWIFLLIAGILEIIWVICLKHSEGFSKILPLILVLLTSSLSLFFLSLSIKQINIGTAYAIWTGIGIVGTTLYGILFLKEPLTPTRLILIGLIAIGILGLKLTDKQ